MQLPLPLKFWQHSASSPLLNPEIIIIYHNQGSHPPDENKSSTAMLRPYSIQCNFTGTTIAQIKLRGSSVAWISTVIAEERKCKGIHCLSLWSSVHRRSRYEGQILMKNSHCAVCLLNNRLLVRACKHINECNDGNVNPEPNKVLFSPSLWQSN